MKFKDFFKECHEKDVFKNLSIYVVSSWVLIQVFSTVWEPFGLPKITMTYLLLLLLIGFPLYTYLLWKFKLKPLESKLSRREGLKFSDKQATSKSVEGVVKKRKIHLPGIHFYSPFQKMYFTALFVITLLAIFSTSLIVRANFINENGISTLTSPYKDTENSNRIAVLMFENNTTKEDLDMVGKMAEDWIMHGISQNKIGQVISPKYVQEYSKVLKASIIPIGENSVLKEYLKPSQMVNGSYYLNGGRLLMKSSILDGTNNSILVSFDPVECSVDSPLDCIEELKQRILGYFISRGKDKRVGLEETPPRYEAYQLFLEANEISYLEPDHIRLLDEAIDADSTFIRPKIDRMSYYYNQFEFATADSLLQLLSKDRSPTNSRQKNILLHYENLLSGDNRNAYKYWMEDYKLEPFNLELNSTAMVLALQFVNKPQEIDTIYNAYGLEDKNLVYNILLETRFYIKGLANMELGRSKETIELFQPFTETKMKDYDWNKEILIRAHAIEGNKDSVDALMDHIKIFGDQINWRKSCLITGNEFLRVGNVSAAKEYYDLLITSMKSEENSSQYEMELLARAYFYKKEFQKAQDLLEIILPKSSDQITYITYLAMAYNQNGYINKAEMLLNQLDNLRSDYQFGDVDYAMARYFAIAGEEEKAMDFLLKAVAAGKRYNPANYQHDILFKPYVGTEAFKRIMHYWY